MAPPELPADLEALTAELVRLKDQGTGEVPRLVLFGSGRHREGEPPYSREEIAGMVRNFGQFSTGPDAKLPVTIGLDHVPNGPAVGRVSRLWEEPGGVLACSFAELPALWAQAIRHGLWFRVSADIDQPPFGVPAEGLMVVGVTLLGQQRPQLKWTSHLQDLVRYAERRPAAPRWQYSFTRTPTGLRLYAEARTMAKTSLRDAFVVLLKKEFPQLSEDFLATQSDDQLAALAESGGGGAASGDATTPDRSTATDELLAADPTLNRADLEAMDDVTFWAAYQKATGKTVAGYGETTEDKKVTVTITKPTPAATDGDAAKVAAALRDANAKAEQLIGQMKSYAEQADKAAKRSVETVQQFHQTEREKAKRLEVESLTEQALDAGVWTSADTDDVGGRRLTEPAKLLLMDDSVTRLSYAENGVDVKKTAYRAAVDDLKAKIAATPRRKGYGEGRERVPPGGAAAGIDYAALRTETAANYAARNAPSANPLRQRLGMLPPAHQR
jgi:hypothetical protein